MTTEIISTKVFIAWAIVPTAEFAIAAQNRAGIIELIDKAIPSITAIAVAWIAYKQHTHIQKQEAIAVKQDELKVTVEKLEKNTDGMNTQLQKAVAGESLAIGREQGKAEAETKAGLIATAKAEGAAEEKALK